MHDYPLFLETIRDIEDKDIKNINELLEKNDEYYLKKAIIKLKDLINYVKDTSSSIQKEYAEFDKLAHIWEEITFTNIDDKKLKKMNEEVKKANQLIKEHDIKDLIMANKIMQDLIKLAKHE